jgi:hypothetical protein
MAKLRGQRRLPAKPSDELFVAAERRQHSLEADSLLEAPGSYAGRFEGFRHAAHTQSAHQAVRTKVSRLAGHPP